MKHPHVHLKRPDGYGVLEKLDTFWNQSLSEVEPIAHELKRVRADRWVRFHSLPESKRYAETPEERAIILERYNTVIEYLNASCSSLYLVTSQWSDSATLKSDRGELTTLDPHAVFWKSVSVQGLAQDDYPVFLQLYVSQWEWRKGIFDTILVLVANDELANVMIINAVDKWVYHPYDGGADVILNSTEERDKLRQNYFMWLSNHPSGY
jgi:hypothetical protein